MASGKFNPFLTIAATDKTQRIAYNKGEITMNNLKTRENKARHQLKEQGYILEKRTNTVNPYHSGCYRILNGHTGTVEAGADFDLTLDEVEKFISE